MRPILGLLTFLVLTVSAVADGWLLKAPYEAKTKLTYSVKVHANADGQDHDAAFKQILEIESRSDTELKAKASWADVTVDGSDAPQELPGWAITLTSKGAISSATDGADYFRMLSPSMFAYPDKEIKVGDKWTSKSRPEKDAKDIIVDYEVLEQVKVGEIDALRVKAKLSEEGGMSGNDTFWVGKDGRILKFDLDLKGWVVPFAGSSAVDAKITGEIVSK